MNETETILQCQAGDSSAFGQIFSSYRDGAYRYCLGMVGSNADALDIVQEAFTAAFKGIGRLDATRGFAGWFYGILRHLCLATLRQHKQTSKPEILERLADAGPSPEAGLQLSERRSALVSGLDQLTPLQREVIVMRELEGHTYDQIAQQLDVPMGTVMSRLYDARRALARIIKRNPVFSSEVSQ